MDGLPGFYYLLFVFGVMYLRVYKLKCAKSINRKNLGKNHLFRFYFYI